jgi:hypothetical protein
MIKILDLSDIFRHFHRLLKQLHYENSTVFFDWYIFIGAGL